MRATNAISLERMARSAKLCGSDASPSSGVRVRTDNHNMTFGCCGVDGAEARLVASVKAGGDPVSVLEANAQFVDLVILLVERLFLWLAGGLRPRSAGIQVALLLSYTASRNESAL